MVLIQEERGRHGNPELEMKRKQQLEILEKQYNGKKIIISSFLLGFSLIIVFVLYVVFK